MSHIKWTLEKIHTEALRFTSRMQFQRQSRKAYRAAIRIGALEQVCGHMSRRSIVGNQNPNFKWTNEALLTEAKRFSSRKEFQTKSPNAYQAARHHNILNSVCSHMSRQKSSLEEKLRQSIINHYGASTIEANRRFRVNIANKPHIKLFELDIYLPEFERAIEFDGKYWHTTNILRKDREHWPETDLLDYHAIKDSFFQSIGIKVMHIKEIDFLKDSDKCIRQCIDFIREA